MTDIPPSRWKVVERGRRLVVIDTLTGQEANSGPSSVVSARELEQASSRAGTTPFGGLEKLRFDGGGALTTHPLYDSRGPRTIKLDPASATLVGRVRVGAALVAMMFVLLAIAQPFALIILPFVLLQPKVRAQVRDAITRWLDAREADAA